MNRREFGTLIIVFSALGSSLSCLFSSVYKNIKNYVPFALLAFDRVIQILEEHGIAVSGLVEAMNRVKAALADIQSAILAYQEANSDQKPTAIGIIRAALQVARTSLEDFWRSLKIPNAQLAGTIKALLTIIISTLAGFEAQLPMAAGAAPAPRMGKEFGSPPKVRTLNEFRDDFNQILRSNDESKFQI